MGQTVAIILLAAVLAGGIYLYLRIRKSIRLFSMATFGTEHLIEGIQGHKDKLATTPKSVSGMTGICLPQIQRDFPEFSLEEAVQKAEDQLKAALAAIERQDLEPLDRRGLSGRGSGAFPEYQDPSDGDRPLSKAGGLLRDHPAVGGGVYVSEGAAGRGRSLAGKAGEEKRPLLRKRERAKAARRGRERAAPDPDSL